MSLSRTREPEQSRTALPVSPFRLSLGDFLAVGNLITVACGGGALSVPAAGLDADVLATDLSSGVLDLLRHRAEEAGVSGWPATRPDRTS